MSNLTDVQKWQKRLTKKGPFFLYAIEDFDKSFLRSDGVMCERIGKSYTVIWNDANKTKIGVLSDHMSTRYGISTFAVLNGDRPHDLWNGSKVSDEQFHEMLAVRNGESKLPAFNLEALRNISF